jgi:hypothetical protein
LASSGGKLLGDTTCYWAALISRILVRTIQERAGDDEEDQAAAVKEVDILGIQESIGTCPDAFAVFETITARDAAVDISIQSGGSEFIGMTITLNGSRVGPQSAQSPNSANADPWFKVKRILWDLELFVWGLAVWDVAFDLPEE